MVEKRIYAVSAFGKLHRQVFHLASMLFRPGGRKRIDPKSAPLKTLRPSGRFFSAKPFCTPRLLVYNDGGHLHVVGWHEPLLSPQPRENGKFMPAYDLFNGCMQRMNDEFKFENCFFQFIVHNSAFIIRQFAFDFNPALIEVFFPCSNHPPWRQNFLRKFWKLLRNSSGGGTAWSARRIGKRAASSASGGRRSSRAKPPSSATPMKPGRSRWAESRRSTSAACGGFTNASASRTNNTPGLFWSHFYAALDWPDAEMWLQGAVESDWSIGQMRDQRWEAHGAPGELKPSAADIVTNEVDEDAIAPDAAGAPRP